MEMIENILENFRKISNNIDIELIEKAYRYAQKYHHEQKRASGENYIIHPYNVALILAGIFDNSPLIAAGLLHDVVEDTKITIEDIENEFGQEIAFLVDGVTKLEKYDFKRVAKWYDTHTENYRKLILASTKDSRVILIKLADRLHNMQTLTYMPIEKQKRIAEETLKVYAPIAELFGINSIKWELEDLSFKILHKSDYDIIAKTIAQKRKDREAYLDKLIKEVSKKLTSINLNFRIYGRNKHFYSIYNKSMNKMMKYDDILDLIAVRIIVNEISECYTVAGIIHHLYKAIISDKDYIQKPKINGYQSLHLAVEDDNGRKIEFQIRTQKMHKIAEIGAAAHWKYKKEYYNIKNSDIEKHENQLRHATQSLSQSGKEKYDFKLDMFSQHIFVLTPQGFLIKLPQNSTPLDFAFYIHSEVGLHAKAARVDGKYVPLKTKLKQGSVVEIFTSKRYNCHTGWEEIAVSKKAKSKIHSFLRKKLFQDALELGKELFKKRSRKYHIPHKTKEEILEFARRFKFYNLQDFYYAIGKGDFVINYDTVYGENTKPQKQNKMPSDTSYKSYESIRLGYINNLMINFAKCCNPKPYDEIIGYITRGRGISIHRKDCTNPGFLNLIKKDNNRIIDVNWDNANKFRHQVFFKLKIKIGKNRSKSDKISKILDSMNIYYYRPTVTKKRSGYVMQITILNISESDFEKIKSEVAKIESVVVV